MDLNTGEMLLGNNIHDQRAPASLTKIMTAVLALEKGNINDIVTISRNAARSNGHQLGLSQGERIELGKLLTATLINSGNDGAKAIAEHIGGSVRGFVDMMNAKAKELGMDETHFMNPSGLPEDNHYSSAKDLAVLASYAMQDEYFRNIVKTKKIYFPTFGNRMDIILESTNKLLIDYPLCDGVKTGYTDDAKYCVIASATYKNHRMLAVVLGAEKNCRWPAAKELLEWGFGKVDPEYTIYANFIDPDR